MTLILLIIGAGCFLLAGLGVTLGGLSLLPFGLLAWIVAEMIAGRPPQR